MKTKFLALILALVMVVSVLPASVFATETTEMVGRSFTSNYVFKTREIFTNTPLTYEAWVNVPSSVTGRAGVILSTYPNTSKVPYAFTFEIHEKGRPRVYFLNNGVAYDNIFTDISVNAGEWTHVAIAFDTENDTLNCYINGVLKGTKVLDGAVVDGIVSGRSLAVCGDHRVGNGVYFQGKVASIAAYSDLRSASEVAADMNALDKSDLIFAYDFSESDKVRYEDLSGNGYFISYGGADLVNKEDVTPVTDYAYSFAVIGDTQSINYNYPNDFLKMYDWIYDNAESQNIKFLIGLGDITETFAGKDAEWERAAAAHKKIEGVVPYALVRGNHDSESFMKKYFPFTQASDGSNGSMNGDTANSYYKFNVGDIKYMVVLIDYGALDNEVAWAEQVIAQNPDYNVIVATHAYLASDGEYFTQAHSQTSAPSCFGGNNGDVLFEKLIGKYENIVMVLCGHDPTPDIIYREDEGANGHVVPQILIDPQTEDTMVGTGTVSMFYFSEDGRNVKIKNYCSVLDCYLGSNSKDVSINVDTVDETARYDQYTVTADENGKVEIPSYIPEQGCKIFSGWTDSDGNYVTADSVFSANQEVVLNANFVDFDKDMLSCKVDGEGNTNDQNPVPKSALYENGMYLQGAQVRIPERDNKSLGLRFITVFNTDIKAVFENGSMDFERGMLVIPETHFESGNELLLTTSKVTTVKATKIFASTATLGKNYDKYTACVINIPEAYFDSVITVRPYFTYTDLSGTKHVFYGEQYECTLYAAASAAYNATDSNGDYVETQVVRDAIYETIIKKVLGDNDTEIEF